MIQIKYASIGLTKKDLSNPKIMLISIVPLLIYIIVAIGMIVYAYNDFNVFIKFFPNVWVEFANEKGALNTVAMAILCLFAWIIIFFIIFLMANILIMIFFNAVSPFIIKYLHKTYYSDITLNPANFVGSNITSIKILLQTFIKLAVFGIVSYLLAFIGLGFISFFIMFYAHYNFYAKNITYQVASSIMNNNEFALFFRTNRVPLFFINIIGYLLSIIPFFGQLFLISSMISLAHFMLTWYKNNADNINDLYIQDINIYEKN